MRVQWIVFLAMMILFGGVVHLCDAADEPEILNDRTLVVWVTMADVQQRGTGVFTIQNGANIFDGLIYGEIRPRVWMGGSDYFRRTERDQSRYPEETETQKLIQLAIASQGKSVEIYRDGVLVSRYTIPGESTTFSSRSEVLFGVHHLNLLGSMKFRGEIEDARIYNRALTQAQIQSLRPNEKSEPAPWAWWTFQQGIGDEMKRFPDGVLNGRAKVEGGRLKLGGGFLAIGLDTKTLRSRETELWPRYHVTALPEEGLCRPYDANGCIYWNGRYHLMYIYQDPDRPNGGHCWGHASSSDLVNWTFHPPALVPNPGDPDTGIFSGNAFVNRDGKPMLCWFGVDAGVCVATAEDADLIHWKKHPSNPVIPVPKPGTEGHGRYHVWDPYLWLEGKTYYCLLGGNRLPSGKDTLYLMRSNDLIKWEPVHPFYEADPRWTVRGEDCSCPDFFKLGSKHVLMSISHNVGGRCYVGRLEHEKFIPEKHIRMNWPGGNFFAPESLEDHKQRRIFWAWVTDPRSMTTQIMTGSGVQSLPRVLTLTPEGDLGIEPVPELQSLRGERREITAVRLEDSREFLVPGVAGNSLEIELEIEPDGGGPLPPVLTGGTREVIVTVLASPDGREETRIIFDTVSQLLKLDVSQSTLREDVLYQFHPLDSGGMFQNRRPGEAHRRPVVEAPLVLSGDEPLKLRIFLDQSMLEVFANGRQCITQQVYPSLPESRLVKLQSRGGQSQLRQGTAWELRAAEFSNHKHP